MDHFGTGYGEPVRSLQSFMRKISEHNPAIPPVIPDGIFGIQTRAAVLEFQRYFALKSTGEVDHVTWEKVLEVYDSVVEETREPKRMKVFPHAGAVFTKSTQSEHLFAMQGILLALTRHFSNIGSLAVTGVHDESSAAVVQGLQAAFGLPVTGNLDVLTWEYTQRLYESTVIPLA